MRDGAVNDPVGVAVPTSPFPILSAPVSWPIPGIPGAVAASAVPDGEYSLSSLPVQTVPVLSPISYGTVSVGVAVMNPYRGGPQPATTLETDGTNFLSGSVGDLAHPYTGLSAVKATLGLPAPISSHPLSIEDTPIFTPSAFMENRGSILDGPAVNETLESSGADTEPEEAVRSPADRGPLRSQTPDTNSVESNSAAAAGGGSGPNKVATATLDFSFLPIDVVQTATGLEGRPLAEGGTGTSDEETEAALIPGDTQFPNQWHLQNTLHPGIDLNVIGVWDEYQGDGVVVGVLDEGINYNHSDLAPRYRHDLDYDARDNDDDAFASAPEDNHGTWVAGVATAAIGNGGAVGVAPGADLTGFRVGFGTGPIDPFVTQISNFTSVDVANNSWSYTGFFADDVDGSMAAIGNALQNAATVGRGGLGTFITFSAGNQGDEGHDVNNHGMQSSRFTTAVGAIEQDGDLSYFSTTGAAVMVSAPGTAIHTTDVSGGFVTVNGTSFSAPAVAGVSALMLEANPDLGYRDIQEILGYSAVDPKGGHASFQDNDATTFNGGGLTFSHDYGYGLVDAHAAVRLAETWHKQSTEQNVISVSAENLAAGASLPDLGSVSFSTNFLPSIRIQHVEVHMDIEHTYFGDLEITLTGPGGTESTLMNRLAYGNLGGGRIDWDFSSVAHWGESSVGTWTLEITDHEAADTGILHDLDLAFYGDAITDDDVYIYTDEYSLLGSNADRQQLDEAQGTDTLNFAAVSSDVTIDLTAGAANSLLGHSLNIGASTVIENAIGGDGADQFTGNASNNELSGTRGDDVLFGGAGDDILDGGDGQDTAVYAGNFADFDVIANGDGSGSVTRTASGDSDTLTNIETLSFDDVNFDFGNTVLLPNTPPVPTTTEISAAEDGGASGVLSATDADGDHLTFALAEALGQGELAIAENGSYSFTDPNDTLDDLAEGETRDLNFRYSVSDGHDVVEQQATITVTGANDAPEIDLPSTATTLGAVRLINEMTPGAQFDSRIDSLPNGGFVAVWRSDSTPGDEGGSGISMRLFDAAGQPAGPETNVPNSSISTQMTPDVLALPNGNFVVT